MSSPVSGPHANRYILVYVNPTGREAYDKGRPFPAGSVIVKAKCRKKADDQPVQLGVMIKRAESWEYAFVNFDGKLVAADRLRNCARCHARAKNDSVFGTATSASR